MANRGYLALGFIFCFLSLFKAQIPQWNQRLNNSSDKSWIDFGFSNDSTPSRKAASPPWAQTYPLAYTDSCGSFFALTPLVNFSLGHELGVDTLRYQNSRGALILAGGRTLKIHTLLMENQAVFPNYQRDFIQKHGEFYFNSNGYTQSNGMVPGEARTKPFKDSGFDYLYARGGFQWAPRKRIMIFGGNQQILIGYGARSLFWGDHNQALILGAQYHITKHVSYVSSRGRLYDLLRRPSFEGVESNYYKRGYALNGLVFRWKIHEACLVYQSLWNGGSLTKEARISPYFWVPIPGLNFLDKNTFYQPQIGVCYKIQPTKTLQFYGEVFTRNFIKNTMSFQAGGNFIGKVTQNLYLNAHVSFLHSGNSFYGDTFEGGFSHNNLPLGSLLGNGVDELQIITQWRIKRLQVNHQMHYYKINSPKNIMFLPSTPSNDPIFHSVMEVGVLVNYPSQLMIYLGMDFRTSHNNTLFWSGGIKTALFRNQHAY